MNLYITDNCPIKSAKNLNDKDLVKMIYDSAQLLSTVIYHYSQEDFSKVLYTDLNTRKEKNLYYFLNQKMLTPIRKNHILVKWVKNTHANYAWTFRYFNTLCNEYEKRFKKEHHLFKMKRFFISASFVAQWGKLEKFVNCASNENSDFRDLTDTKKAYKLFLMNKNINNDIKTKIKNLNKG